MSKRVFAEKIGVEAVTLRSWFTLRKANPRPENIVQLAKVLKISESELRKRIEESAPREETQPDQNVVRGSMVKLVEIPIFDRDLAAGNWTEAIAVEEWAAYPEQIKQGLFRVRLGGKSMEKRYPDRSLVEFRLVPSRGDGLIAGRDFYIQRDDDMATFKRVEKIEDEVVTLRALNVKKFPDPMRVERSRIVRSAEAVNIVVPV
jgi:transcriptional regulator with XRE-family HTH domain